MSCLRGRAVDTLIFTWCDYSCLCRMSLAAAVAAAHNTDNLVLTLTANHHPFSWTPTIHLWSTFDNISRPNRNTLFDVLFIFYLISICYRFVEFLQVTLSHPSVYQWVFLSYLFICDFEKFYLLMVSQSYHFKHLCCSRFYKSLWNILSPVVLHVISTFLLFVATVVCHKFPSWTRHNYTGNYHGLYLFFLLCISYSVVFASRLLSSFLRSVTFIAVVCWCRCCHIPFFRHISMQLVYIG